VVIRKTGKTRQRVVTSSLTLLVLFLSTVLFCLQLDGTDDIGLAEHPSTVPLLNGFHLTAAKNEPPVAIASPSSAQVRVGERLFLSAKESYDSDGSIIEYRWSFESGSRVARRDITLVFAEPGLDTVILTVVDNYGENASTVVPIKVLPPTPEPILILTAGPDNMLELEAGGECVITLNLVAYNQKVYNPEVEILDSGGLEITVDDIPRRVEPGSPEELHIRIGTPNDVNEVFGSTVKLHVASESTVSNVERIDVMIRPQSTQVDVTGELIQISMIVASIVVVYALVAVWKRRRGK
jgi:hypothetical protein